MSKHYIYSLVKLVQPQVNHVKSARLCGYYIYVFRCRQTPLPPLNTLDMFMPPRRVKCVPIRTQSRLNGYSFDQKIPQIVPFSVTFKADTQAASPFEPFNLTHSRFSNEFLWLKVPHTRTEHKEYVRINCISSRK